MLLRTMSLQVGPNTPLIATAVLLTTSTLPYVASHRGPVRVPPLLAWCSHRTPHARHGQWHAEANDHDYAPQRLRQARWDWRQVRLATWGLGLHASCVIDTAWPRVAQSQIRVPQSRECRGWAGTFAAVAIAGIACTPRLCSVFGDVALRWQVWGLILADNTIVSPFVTTSGSMYRLSGSPVYVSRSTTVVLDKANSRARSPAFGVALQSRRVSQRRCGA